MSELPVWDRKLVGLLLKTCSVLDPELRYEPSTQPITKSLRHRVLSGIKVKKERKHIALHNCVADISVDNNVLSASLNFL